MQRGPILVSASNGFPTLIFFDFSMIILIKLSKIFLCISPRDPATQLCPEAPKFPAINPFAALSKFASSKTIIGDFPPNSKEVAAKFSEEFLITCLAVSGPPVKAIRSISGWLVNGIEQFSASPVITDITPGGKPACSINFANSNIGAGAISEALRITVQPAAKAGPSFVAVKNI